MRITLLTYALLLISLASACSQAATEKAAGGTKQQADGQQRQAQQNQDLQKQIEQIAGAANGKVGIAAVVLETGETVSLNFGDHFPMQSVYKLPIGMAVMRQVEAGKIKLDQKVRVTKEDFIGVASHSPIRDQHPNGVELSVGDLLGWMLMESDGTASDVLMKLAGGPAAIQAYLNELGIKDLIVLDTEKAFAQDHSLQFRNWATPEAAVALLRVLHERRGLSETSQAFLLKLMTQSTPGAKRLKGLLPAGTVVAHKTGTSNTDNGVTAATNDIGLITLPNGRHLAIAVFVSNSPADEATREGVIAKVAKAIYEKFAGGLTSQSGSGLSLPQSESHSSLPTTIQLSPIYRSGRWTLSPLQPCHTQLQNHSVSRQPFIATLMLQRPARPSVDRVHLPDLQIR